MLSEEAPLNNGRLVSAETVAQYIWGSKCEGWWLKEQGKFTVILETMPNGSSEIKHFHRSAEQFFYVLEGVLSIELEDMSYDLKQHEGVGVMPGEVHKVFNRFDQSVKFLVVSCPNSHGDRIDLEKKEK